MIGDAAGHTRIQTDERRKYKGEDYWIKNNFYKCYGDVEVDKLAQKNIPVHSFYINSQRADWYFKGVSDKTKGECQEFHIYDPNASNNLAKFIAERILEQSADDATMAKNMKEAYADYQNQKRYK